jgi:arabinogalactan endo-1,4-beta-galactosidase
VSFLQELEARGQRYLDASGAAVDPLQLLRDRGVTTIRLRLWNAPPAGWCDLPHTLAMARRVRQAGLRLLLDLHYSDGWADPGHQAKPAAWEAMHGAELEAAVEDFTRDAVAQLAAQGTPPQLVQLGNEITAGLLWEDGRLAWTPASWQRVAGLLQAGVRGVRAGAGAGPRPQVAIHIDRGGDASAAHAFFQQLTDQGLDFDVIGLSYYPWWHGPLDALTSNVRELRAFFPQEVLVLETSYPWTDQAATAAGNSVWTSAGLLPGFPPTPAGQQAYLRALVSGLKLSGGAGVFWWAPEWLPAPGLSQPTAGFETLTLFDLGGRPLPALDELGSG